ncbi:acyl carrier protein [Oxalobacter sp. OttesenSCG-928-P03]|nr:acyl carrier protein [Oxalobacter sp. OttesenSCG-928-P03]
MDDIKKILAETFRVNINDINSNTTIEQIDTWDSLTHMELVANLETRLGIEFDGDEIAEMISVAAIEALVKHKK